jgi:hypothetical protein
MPSACAFRHRHQAEGMPTAKPALKGFVCLRAITRHARHTGKEEDIEQPLRVGFRNGGATRIVTC